MSQKVTLKSIAKKANVSISAVSLVLNNKPCRISKEKREEIIKIAKKSNYRPNLIARSLVTNISKILGLIVPDLENLFFSSLTKGIESNCKKDGYSLMIINTNDSYHEDCKAISLLSSRKVDGLFIVLGQESYRHKKKIKELLANLNIPFVLVDRNLDNFECNQVFYDNELGAYKAVSYLIQNGHSKIGCIKGPDKVNNSILRFKGYCHALKENNIKINKKYIVDGDFRYLGGFNATKALMNEDITAIFVSNDMMALGCMNYLIQHKISIPKEISIISYDNVLYRYLLGNEITSVAQDIPILAKKAYDLLKENLNNVTKNQIISLSPVLIEKNSVQKLR